MALYEKLVALLERLILICILWHNSQFAIKAKSIIKASDAVRETKTKVRSLSRSEKVKMAVSDE